MEKPRGCRGFGSSYNSFCWQVETPGGAGSGGRSIIPCLLEGGSRKTSPGAIPISRPLCSAASLGAVLLGPGLVPPSGAAPRPIPRAHHIPWSAAGQRRRAEYPRRRNIPQRGGKHHLRKPFLQRTTGVRVAKKSCAFSFQTALLIYIYIYKHQQA